MRKENKTHVKLEGLLKWAASLAALFIILTFSLFIGPVRISYLNIIRIIEEQVFPWTDAFPRAGVQWEIVVLLREPEILGALIVGSTLAVGGAVVQSVFRNPITEPYIIGVSSGAALGAVIALDLGITIAGLYTLPLFAFLFSVVTVTVVYMSSFRKGKVPLTYLLLTGIAISLFVSSIVAYVIYSNLRLQSSIYFWLMGSLSQLTWTDIAILLSVNSLSMFASALYWREMDSLQLGEEYAASVGINVERTKLALIMLVTLSTSVSVSFTGLIGFVGLIVPHMARIIFGGSNRLAIAGSAIIGAIFLIICEDIANVVITQEVLPIGIITGMIGAPFFIYLLTRLSRGGYTA